MDMKEMVYDGKEKAEVLAQGTLCGVEYAILSYGTHPCAYVMIPDGSPILEKGFDTSEIECHGGLTYSGKGLRVVDEKKQHFWIGWDYCHYMDYRNYPSGVEFGGRRYKTAEIYENVVQVIRQLLDRGGLA